MRTSKNRSRTSTALAVLILACVGISANGGEGSARQVAAKGDHFQGGGTDKLEFAGTALGIDASGRVLFSSAINDDDDPSTPAVGAWFVGNGTASSVILRQQQALPAGGTLNVAGLTFEGLRDPFWSLAGRAGFTGVSVPNLKGHEVAISSDSLQKLRTVSAMPLALPGLCIVREQFQNYAGLIHDDWLFLPAGVGNRLGEQPPPCTPGSSGEELGAVLIARRAVETPQIVVNAGAAVPTRAGATFVTAFKPRGAFPDGSVVFTATVDVPNSQTHKSGIFAWKPGVPLHSIAIDGENAPGTAETIGNFAGAFGPIRIADGANADFVEVVFAARLGNDDWAIYSTRQNSGSAPVVRTGAKDGLYQFVAGKEAPAGLDVIPGPIGQLIVIGATTGPDVKFGKGIGVWRHDPIAPKTFTLLTYVGATFKDGASTFTIDSIRSVAVNAAGRVAMEVNFTPKGLTAGNAALLEKDTGGFACAVRSGDLIPVREDRQSLGTGRVISIGRDGQQRFPDVTGTGLDGYPTRFNAAGQFVTTLGGFSTGIFASGPYTFSLGTQPEPPPPPKPARVRVRAKRGAVKVTGTNGKDSFSVIVDADGLATITPGDATTVNDSSEPLVVDASRSLTIKTKKGDDDVTVTGPAGGATIPKIVIDTNSGTSTVKLTDIDSSKITVKGRDAMDIFLKRVSAGRVSLGGRTTDFVMVDADDIEVIDRLKIQAAGAGIDAKRTDGVHAFQGDVSLDADKEAAAANAEIASATADRLTVALVDLDADLGVRDCHIKQVTWKCKAPARLPKRRFACDVDKSNMENFYADMRGATGARLTVENTEFGARVRFLARHQATSVVFEMINSTFGTSFRAGALFGSKKTPNIEVRLLDVFDGENNPVLDLKSVFKDLQGVFSQAKR